MTRAQLQDVRVANALPHSLPYDRLAPYHIPFDELTGRAAVEAELGHWIARRGRVALIGPSGSGKSSALAWALAQHAPTNVTPLRIPVALADDDSVQTVEGFARHAIRRVIAIAHLHDAEAAELRARSADAVRQQTGGRRRTARAGVRVAVINAELARELTRASSEFEQQITAGEVVEGLQRLVEIFRARDTEPLLILEDSDTWIARPHDTLPARLAEAFFGRNIRMLATELDCGFVVAVHDTYLALAAYKAIAGRLEPVVVPPLSKPQDQLKRILARRLEVAGLDLAVEEIFAAAALEVLASLYDDAPDVRRAIATAATAVRLSLDDAELEQVSAAAVRAAAAERDDHARHS